MCPKRLRLFFKILLINTLLLWTFPGSAQTKGAKVESVNTSAGSERRMALVMGNKTYEHANSLKNPGHDAQDMATALRKLGFEVSPPILDADYRGTMKAINEFVARLQPGDIVVFYYSGHGIGYNGKNYLLPVDADIDCIERIDEHGISLGRLLSQFEQRQVRTSLLFLDACRNMPSLKACQSSAKALTTQGLVRPANNPRGSMIIFATEEGTTADDNLAGRNGLFTSELLKYITQPGLGIRAIIDSTTAAVELQTNGLQSPARYDKLWGDFIFVREPGQKITSPVLSNPPVVLKTDALNKPGNSSSFNRPALPAASTVKGAYALVKGGEYKMGALNRPYNEQPPHEVRVSGFQMARYEVTVSDWKAFCQATQRSMPTIPDPDLVNPTNYWQGKDRFPITNVSWFDAVEYANWLSEQQGFRKAYHIQDTSVDWDRTANGYRLPTEAEWELAARGNSPDFPYAGSRAEQEVSWSQINSNDATHPVGTRKPNDLDLYDLSGNVWEVVLGLVR